MGHAETAGTSLRSRTLDVHNQHIEIGDCTLRVLELQILDVYTYDNCVSYDSSTRNQ